MPHSLLEAALRRRQQRRKQQRRAGPKSRSGRGRLAMELRRVPVRPRRGGLQWSPRTGTGGSRNRVLSLLPLLSCILACCPHVRGGREIMSPEKEARLRQNWEWDSAEAQEKALESAKGSVTELSKEAVGQPAAEAQSHSPGPRPSLTLTWIPNPNSYLLATCHYGRLTNQLKCLRAHLAFAAALNRTLVLPHMGFLNNEVEEYRWHWTSLLDLRFSQSCLTHCCSPHALIPLSDYLSGSGTHNRTAPHPCLKLDRIVRIPGVSMPARPEIRMSDICYDQVQRTELSNLTSSRYVTKETLRILSKFTDSVLSFDSLFEPFFVDYPASLRTPPLTLPPNCTYFWEPSARVKDAAKGFINDIIGTENFAALHFRRGPTFSFKHFGLPSFPPVLSTAEFLIHHLKAAAADPAMPHISKLFVASDASPAEMSLLSDLLEDEHDPFHITIVHVSLGSLRNNSQYNTTTWLTNLRDTADFVSYVIEAFTEQYVCAQANIFFRTLYSSFSDNIQLMRTSHGWNSTCDRPVKIERRAKG